MFDLFDTMLVGTEIEFEGKKYVYIKAVNSKMLMVVETGVTMPAPVVIIPLPQGEK